MKDLRRETYEIILAVAIMRLMEVNFHW